MPKKYGIPFYAAEFSSDASEFTVENGVLTAYTGSGSYVAIPSNLGITVIGGWAFAQNKDITSVTIPSGVTKIGQHAFQMCEKLVSVSLPRQRD